MYSLTFGGLFLPRFPENGEQAVNHRILKYLAFLEKGWGLGGRGKSSFLVKRSFPLPTKRQPYPKYLPLSGDGTINLTMVFALRNGQIPALQRHRYRSHT